MTLDDGALVLEVAHISAASPGGPRFDPSLAAEQLQNLANLIVLCPTHHMLVDAQPQTYSADFLRQSKFAQRNSSEDKQKRAISLSLRHKPPGTKQHLTYSAALDFWHANRISSEEEKWHAFFKANPKILALSLPDDLIIVGDKCYLGGKNWTNKGGGVVDFLFASRQTAAVTIIEIKTPRTELMSREYRSDVVLPSRELIGSVMQAWSYRDTLLKNYYSTSKDQGVAFNPKCLVLIGDMDRYGGEESAIRSFELFRNSLNNTSIITYDALFSKVAATYDFMLCDAEAL